MYEEHYTESMDTAKKYFGYISDFWISGYLYEIFLKKNLKKYENSEVIKNTFFKLYYLKRLLGLRWGWGYLWKRLMLILRYKIGRYYLRQWQNESYLDGGVSRLYCLSLDNKISARSLLLKGWHSTSYKRPLKIRIIINGDKICNLNIRKKGEFKVVVDLLGRYKNADLLTVVLGSNKTFVHSKRGTNNGAASIFLEKVMLC
jgi:hypothetical protein